MKPIQIPDQGGKPVNILGISMLIRVHGHDTNGTVAVVESHDVPGGGPPPHIHHREDETFQILEGEYEWTVGGKTSLPKWVRPFLRRAGFRTPIAMSANRLANLCVSSRRRASRVSSMRSAL